MKKNVFELLECAFGEHKWEDIEEDVDKNFVIMRLKKKCTICGMARFNPLYEMDYEEAEKALKEFLSSYPTGRKDKKKIKNGV